VLCTPLRLYGNWAACLGAGHIPTHTRRLGSAFRVGTPQHTRGAWALPLGWALPSASIP